MTETQESIQARFDRRRELLDEIKRRHRDQQSLTDGERKGNVRAIILLQREMEQTYVRPI